MNYRHLLAFLILVSVITQGFYDPSYGETSKDTGKRNMNGQNRLKDEQSPYLLQHADNPVDWYPWGEEAFEKARKEDKPILLSIGYSTCHWCHVMEHESFEDEQVAELMNKTFVSIKVDREERPDIDNIYMTVCQMLSKGGCGWPLNIVMTPDRKPFFAATYIPKESRYGRAGMLELVPRIGEIWEQQREEVLKSADSITEALIKTTDGSNDSSGGDLKVSYLTTAYNQLLERFDVKNGGFGSAPKFPTAHNFYFLLRYWHRTGDGEALEMVEKTLTQMRLGGIYDHVGYGFHRYSTDSEWLLPHFEKMLYDQALISMAYTDTYTATGKEAYKKTAEEIFTYVLRDMTAPEGGFYSAEDADSEGEEGKFYVWSEEELMEVLGESDARLVISTYNTDKSGNFTDEASREKTGANILYLKAPLDDVGASHGEKEPDFASRIEEARKKLFEAREKRAHPYKDDKILTDWNGLMIASLAKAGRAFGEQKYTAAAEKAANFILKEMMEEDNNLLHRYRGGEAGIKANLDDYAFFVWGLLELYQSTYRAFYLSKAVELQNKMIELFWDEGAGGFYFTSGHTGDLITRQKQIYDGAVPSGNSVAMMNLLRIGRITAESGYEDKASTLGKAFSKTVETAPMAYTQLLSALDFAAGPSYEVVIVGEPESEDTKKMLSALKNNYNPNIVVILKDIGNASEITSIAPFTESHIMSEDKTTAYVCRDHVCNLPTTDPDKMLEQITQAKQ